jgi:hypothetical protein
VPLGVVERNAQGLFDQDQSRLRYIQHLKSERAQSPRTTADAAHTEVKTEMLRMRLLERQGKLVPAKPLPSNHKIAGAALTALSSMPGCAPGDLATLWRIGAPCGPPEAGPHWPEMAARKNKGQP